MDNTQVSQAVALKTYWVAILTDSAIKSGPILRTSMNNINFSLMTKSFIFNTKSMFWFQDIQKIIQKSDYNLCSIWTTLAGMVLTESELPWEFQI